MSKTPKTPVMIGANKRHTPPGGMMRFVPTKPGMYSYEFRRDVYRAADLIINKPQRPKP